MCMDFKRDTLSTIMKVVSFSVDSRGRFEGYTRSSTRIENAACEKMPMFQFHQESRSFLRSKQNQVSSWVVVHACVFTRSQSHAEPVPCSGTHGVGANPDLFEGGAVSSPGHWVTPKCLGIDRGLPSLIKVMKASFPYKQSFHWTTQSVIKLGYLF